MKFTITTDRRDRHGNARGIGLDSDVVLPDICLLMDTNNPEIPELNSDGLLPSDIYCTSEATIESAFVDAVKNSRTRRTIFEGLCQWRRDAIEARVDEAIQWIDGSFVESKIDPNDVDVVTFIEYEALNTLPVCAKTFIARWMSCGRAQDKYRVDSYFQAYCDTDHEYYAVWSDKQRVYKELFGSTKTSGKSKGFLELILGELDDASHKVFRGDP